jgi:hypothetical protein
MIRGDGYAEFANTQIYGSAVVGGTISSSTQPGWILSQDGSAQFANGNMIIGAAAQGTIWLVSAGGNGQVRIYPAGQTPGVSSTYHFMRPNGTSLEIHGAFGAAVDLHSALDTGMPYVGVVNNVVQLASNAHVNNLLTVGNQLRVGTGGAYFGGGIEINGFVITSEIRGNPQFNWIQPGAARMLQVGASGFVSATAFSPGQVQTAVNATGSALRLKKNITDMSYTREEIFRLRPVDFDWKDTATYDARRHSGFIADEVAAAGLDHFVFYNEKGEIEGLQYGHITAALLKVAKEQQAEIDDLRARLQVAGL